MDAATCNPCSRTDCFIRDAPQFNGNRNPMERDIIETRGVAALRRLYLVACRDSGQCRYIARFLLGLYNGIRFPFDLTDLRAIDAELFDDCMAVLNMDARLTRQEVHTYFEDGGAKFERLAKLWGVEDAQKLRQDAARASQPPGSPVPAHEGGWHRARFVTHSAAPGYRDVTLTFAIGEDFNTHIELQLSGSDSENLLRSIADVQAFAWLRTGQRPVDATEQEKRPDWLDKAPTQWSLY